jgi:hypothetical protein
MKKMQKVDEECGTEISPKMEGVSLNWSLILKRLFDMIVWREKKTC